MEQSFTIRPIVTITGLERIQHVEMIPFDIKIAPRWWTDDSFYLQFKNALRRVLKRQFPFTIFADALVLNDIDLRFVTYCAVDSTTVETFFFTQLGCDTTKQPKPDTIVTLHINFYVKPELLYLCKDVLF